MKTTEINTREINSPFVSVIVAVKNKPGLLQQCIETLKFQTYSNYEVIISDDGSNDETIEILNSISDPRFKIIRSDVSMGQSHARNMAIKIAGGDYLAIADADDQYHPDRLKLQVKFLEKNKNIDVLSSEFKVSAGYKWHIYHNHEFIKAQLLVNNPVVHSSLMIRRKSLSGNEPYNSAFDKSEDYELLARHSKTWVFAGLKAPLVTYQLPNHAPDSVADQTLKARIIRETLLKNFQFNLPHDQIDLYHQFCELRAGLTYEEIKNLMLQFVQSNAIQKIPKLFTILNIQLSLYVVVNKLQIPLNKIPAAAYYYPDITKRKFIVFFKSLYYSVLRK